MLNGADACCDFVLLLVGIAYCQGRTYGYTCRFAANFLCRGNRQIGTHLQQQKRQKQQSQNTKKELFWGAFPKNKMYLFIKFSTRPYIQLEMGLNQPILCQFPAKFFLKTSGIKKSHNFTQIWPEIGPK